MNSLQQFENELRAVVNKDFRHIELMTFPMVNHPRIFTWDDAMNQAADDGAIVPDTQEVTE